MNWLFLEVITINLEFIYNGSLVELDIKRHNSLLIINQEKYIYLYYLFYNSIKRKDNNCNIKINKEEISSKKYTFIDLTSPIAIVNELENKKDTLLFSYTSHIFDKILYIIFLYSATSLISFSYMILVKYSVNMLSTRDFSNIMGLFSVM